MILSFMDVKSMIYLEKNIVTLISFSIDHPLNNVAIDSAELDGWLR